MAEKARAARRRAVLVTCAVGAMLIVPSMAQAAEKWAVFNSAGTLVRGSGATGVVHLALGSYEVQFNSNMTGCAYTATSGDTAAGAVAGPISVSVASRAGNPNALFIQAFDQSTGSLVDEPIHVVTNCSTRGRWAVVSSVGTLARGSSHVLSVGHLAVGAYEVIFDKSVSKCAFVVSPGTTGAGSVGNPGAITVAGRSANKAGVFIRTMDRFGAAVDQSFHLAVSCGKKALLGVIEANGAKNRGLHVVSSQKLSGLNGGTYEVIFDRTVSGCAYVATVGVTGNGGSISTPVQITTATRAGNSSGVFVFIHNQNGSTIDEPFHLVVLC
jgi:hypothetical protein